LPGIADPCLLWAGACLAHQVVEAATEEFNRLPLEFELPILIDLKDG